MSTETVARSPDRDVVEERRTSKPVVCAKRPLMYLSGGYRFRMAGLQSAAARLKLCAATAW